MSRASRQKTGRHRHSPVDTLTALLEALEHHGLAGQVDALRGKGQGLTDPAAGIMQDGAERAHRALGLGRRRDKGATLVGGQIEALALVVVELHRVEQNV
jgi:hypothetical protein